MSFVLVLGILCVFIPRFGAYERQDFGTVPAVGNFTCDEITRWLGAEKHYSNDKKEVLFGLALSHDRCFDKFPVLFLNDIRFGWSSSGKRSFFNLTQEKFSKTCTTGHDEYAVAYLSNYSINNNFSHFLHGLLRLFCALIDARWLVWNSSTHTYVKTVNYSIWLDEYFKISEAKLKWIEAMGGTIRKLKEVSKGQCVSSKVILYGSGCVKLLPPEKWFGYPGCRASQVLPAFGHYMRQRFMGQHAEDLLIIDEHTGTRTDPGLRVAFAVRDVGAETGRRAISNLNAVQALLKKSQHIRTLTENVTFEHLDVPSTVRYMAGVHIFVSVHGAGMTNMVRHFTLYMSTLRNLALVLHESWVSGA